MKMEKRPFGTTRDGQAVTLYRMENHAGAYVELLDWGAHIRALGVPDKDGNIVDVCLGFDDMEGYEQNAGTYMGATVGRNANRIRGAKFTLNNIVYTLSPNEGPNQCHGGIVGFDAHIWNAVMQEQLISFYRTSPHMEEGFPGLLRVTVNFELTSTNELKITYTASGEEDTPVNLTNHAYFNLAGKGKIYDHTLQMNASRITPVDEALLPLGTMDTVSDTVFDLRKPVRLGNILNPMAAALQAACGLDNNFVTDCTGLVPVAVLHNPANGIKMTCYTDLPCAQVYSGNYLDTTPGKLGTPYTRHDGICIETQWYPDAVNCPAFPSVVLPAHKMWRAHTVYAFTVK